jgi:hypothetical protein
MPTGQIVMLAGMTGSRLSDYLSDDLADHLAYA